MPFEFINAALTKRQAQSLLRKRVCLQNIDGPMIRVDGNSYLNFSGNDYLGMAQCDEVKQAWREGIDEYGAGSGASPLVTGYSKAHQQLENYLAEQTGRDKALLFNSGFAANQALCQALMAEGGHIVADKLSHASLIDGALSSAAKLQRFRHNDTEHARQLLCKTSGDTLLVAEGVYSMDGDQAPVKTLAELAKQHEAWLMLDDAHGFGVLGENGLGSAELYQLNQQDLPVLMATFGKAVGTAGAFVTGSEALIEYLLNSARHYIYSTHMPAAQAVATQNSLQIMQQQRWRRTALLENIAMFKQLAVEAGLELMTSDSAIQPLLVADSEAALKVSEQLKQQGLWVTAIRPPTVPTARLRITLSALHKTQHLQYLIEQLSIVLHHGSKF